MYLMLASAFSIMSVWYSVDAPALYCTAITGALCMEIWSLFFFMRAVWVEQEEKKSIRLAFFGSLFGALAFGCRPAGGTRQPVRDSDAGGISEKT